MSVPYYWITYCRKCGRVFTALTLCKCGPRYARWEKANDIDWHMDLLTEEEIEEIENG